MGSAESLPSHSVIEESSPIETFLSKNSDKQKLSVTIDNITSMWPMIYQEENHEIMSKFIKIYQVIFREMLLKCSQKNFSGFIWFTLPKEDSDKYFERISTIFIGKCAEENLPFDCKNLKVGTVEMNNKAHICVYVVPDEKEISV